MSVHTRTVLGQLALALAVSILVVTSLRAIDNRAERARAAEMAKAEQQAREWLHARPILHQAQR